jgi:hypothetical protein
MALDLRVPVCRVAVELVTSAGERRAATLFQAPGQSVAEVFECDEPFMPLDEGGRIRIYARHAIACLSHRPVEPMQESSDDLPYQRRAVRVVMRGGTVIEGELRFMAWEQKLRTADILNDPARSVSIYQGDQVHVVHKIHVECVEET